jgi:hypothetical protein
MISRTIHSTNRTNVGKLFKSLVGICRSFYLFLSFSHTFLITFIQYIHPSPFAEDSLHFLHCLFAQWDNLPGVPSPSFELGPALQQASLALNQPSYAAPCRRIVSEKENYLKKPTLFAVVLFASNPSSSAQQTLRPRLPLPY